MAMRSSRLLGSDEARSEGNVCLVVIRRRVRYWASQLSKNRRGETAFLGALALLDAIADAHPEAAMMHLVKEEVDEWRELLAAWTKRVEKKISKRGVDVDELLANADAVFDKLRDRGIAG